ncbi:SAM-dependent methyltransferase [Alicyclobacillus contaminans]|uniref:class I SAM-dependent methyltransferase n=1 Tax=Alicyclobacillus contaminans TaxID=392016 RepID=UPI0004041852|nr:methyltransferase domain-containing protein [Alicyclobacillus contaminans]GMA52226.1 SAM-dependent methyltransferase [Alicyclobacillus contaminans]
MQEREPRVDEQALHRRTVQAQFGPVADRYVTSEGHAKGGDLVELVDWLRPEPGWRVLDVATGGGHVAKALSPHVARVVASDVTKLMLMAARQHLAAAGCDNVDYVLADAEQLPFLDASFDVVTCRIAPHHFLRPDVFVRESHRVLRPQGRLLIIDNVAPPESEAAEYINTIEKMRDPSHVRCASVDEWRLWLNAAGFDIVRERTRRKAFPFTTWVRRMVHEDGLTADLEQYMLQASAAGREYFCVVEKHGHVESFEGDEWMGLAVKR